VGNGFEEKSKHKIKKEKYDAGFDAIDWTKTGEKKEETKEVKEEDKPKQE
jgi:hypothetical protein